MMRLILILIALSLVSCGEDFFDTTLDIDIPAHEPKLVIHAYGSTMDSFLKIQLTRSQALDENENNISQLFIANAEINVYEDNEFLLTVPENSGASSSSYAFNYISEPLSGNFKEGSTYKIVVKVSGYPIAEASCILPPRQFPQDLAFEEEGGINEEGDQRSSVKMTIDDEATIDNYAEARITLKQLGGQDEYFTTTYTSSVDPSVIQGAFSVSALISDESFNGELKKLDLQMYPTTINDIDGRLYLLWRSISYEHYQFIKTLKAFHDNEDNPFTTPTQIFTNVKNGLGIFSVFHEDLIFVE